MLGDSGLGSLPVYPSFTIDMLNRYPTTALRREFLPGIDLRREGLASGRSLLFGSEGFEEAFLGKPIGGVFG
jgi:hypothetical protein